MNFYISTASSLKANLCMCRIFSDVAGDITIVVNGESFLLHKVVSLSHLHKLQISISYFYLNNVLEHKLN